MAKSSKLKRPLAPLVSPAGGSVLDWPIEAGIGDAFLQQVELRRKKRQRRQRATAVGSAVAMLALVALFWGVPTWRDTSTVATLAAQRSEMNFQDGSHAQLNARTSLSTDFRYGRRIVRLESGEAFFSVAKDTAHPFLVETDAGIVRVTGTQFNVRITRERRTEVTLFEGGVQLDWPERARPPMTLTPGQQFNSAAEEPRGLYPAELENVVAWRDGRMSFDGLTLAQAAERLGDYHGCAIHVAPEIAQLSPGGSHPIDDLKAVMRALEKALSVSVLANADGSYRIVRAAK